MDGCPLHMYNGAGEETSVDTSAQIRSGLFMTTGAIMLPKRCNGWAITLGAPQNSSTTQMMEGMCLYWGVNEEHSDPRPNMRMRMKPRYIPHRDAKGRRYMIRFV